MINVKLKRLKNTNTANVRFAIEHLLKYKFNQWVSTRRMQAYMMKLGADVEEQTIRALMEDIYTDALDKPNSTYSKGLGGDCYKCVAYFLPS